MSKKYFGVIGHPIEHTLSPKMHTYIAESLGINLEYQAFNVAPENLHTEVKGIKQVNKGFNITVPHKIEIMKELDIIAEDAKIIGAVNTAVERDGTWYGYNTDGDGFCASLELEGVAVKGKDILVLGAGGAARGVCYKLAQNGAKSITITARTMEKARAIGEMIEKYSNTKFHDTVNKSYDIIVNTTPLGMHPLEDKNSCTFMDIIRDKTVCCDLIYNPSKTIFLQEAERKGAKIINGLGMLILQGVLAFELFNDVKLDHNKYYNELRSLLGGKNA